MSNEGFELWPVLEHYGWELPAARSGWVTIKCGAHADSHASCRANNEVGAVACMACGFKGDVVKIIQHYEGCGYREALTIAETLSGNSDRRVPRSSRARGSVPSRARDKPAGRGYVSPGRRSRATGRGL